MSIGALLALPAVVDLPTAAAALSIGSTLAYELAQRGEFPCPVIRVGGRWRVPTSGLVDLLGLAAVAAALPAERTAS